METKFAIYSLGIALLQTQKHKLNHHERMESCLVRLYRPRKEILDGTWKFPEAQPQ